MRVIDLTAQSALHVRFDPSPVYDFLAALYLVRHWTPERGFDVDPAWVRAARRALGPRLMADAGLLLPPRSPVLGVLAVLEETPGLSVRAALRRLRQLSPPSLVERMLGGPTAVRPLLLPLRQAIQGDRAALEAVVAAFPREYDPHAVRRLLAAGPAAVHARLLRLLRAFYTRVYAREEARVAPLLAADVAARQALAGVLAPADLVERVTGGFVIAPGTGIAQVLLAPAHVEQDAQGVAAHVRIGTHQWLIFRETDAALRPYDGHHIAIYVANFSAPYNYLKARGLIMEEVTNHQFRFKDLVAPDSGERVFTLEHEVRSLRHPMYRRVLVNRNPDQTLRHYRRGHDALIPFSR